MSKSPLDRAVITWGWDPYCAGFLSAYIELMTQREALLLAISNAVPDQDADTMSRGVNALIDELGSHLLESLRMLAKDTGIPKKSVTKAIKMAEEVSSLIGTMPPGTVMN